MILIISWSYREAQDAARRAGLVGHTWQWVGTSRVFQGVDRKRFAYLLVGTPSPALIDIAQTQLRLCRVSEKNALEFLADKSGRPLPQPESNGDAR